MYICITPSRRLDESSCAQNFYHSPSLGEQAEIPRRHSLARTTVHRFLYVLYAGFPKIRSTFLGVPIIRIIEHFGVYIGVPEFRELLSIPPLLPPLGFPLNSADLKTNKVD